jgi:carboxypeptidase PM20D1
MYLDILIVLIVLIIILAAFLLLRTLAYARPYEPVAPAPLAEVNSERAAEHLAEMIRCETISRIDGKEIRIDPQSFRDLHEILDERYPRVHTQLKLNSINAYSLLYTWEGSDSSLEPVLLMAHQDVVPADPGTLAQWTHPPFDGVIADGYVWGRGTLDIKNQLCAILETVEDLLRQGYKPRRTIYLGFGHDEEVGGHQGHEQIAAWFEQQNIHLGAVIDEGGGIIDGAFPMIKVPAALIGVAEKGVLTLELSVEAKPGHSAMPPAHTAIGTLARGLARLEVNPMRPTMRMVSPMLKEIASAMPFFYQVLFANQWLFGGLLRRSLASSSETNAMLRTTAAITMISGGVKENVLPASARACVNMRLMPGITIAEACEHVRWAIGDESITLKALEGSAWEASPYSSTDSEYYRSLVHTTREVFGSLPVAPMLLTGATDSRYYARLTPNVYRFCPELSTMADLKRAHGIDERISIENLERMMQFFTQLIKAWDKI